MWPVLFSVFGIQIQSYGVSKALAALVAAWLLGRAFRRLGFPVEQAHSLVLWAAVWGFVAYSEGAGPDLALECSDDLRYQPARTSTRRRSGGILWLRRGWTGHKGFPEFHQKKLDRQKRGHDNLSCQTTYD